MSASSKPAKKTAKKVAKKPVPEAPAIEAQSMSYRVINDPHPGSPPMILECRRCGAKVAVDGPVIMPGLCKYCRIPTQMKPEGK